MLDLWGRLGGHWGPARDVRPNQPLLVADTDPPIAPDPEVRLVQSNEVDQLFPAAVAMYTEEVGVSPLLDDGGRGYRRRIAELVRGKRAYARFAGDRVIFKAELAIVTGGPRRCRASGWTRSSAGAGWRRRRWRR